MPKAARVIATTAAVCLAAGLFVWLGPKLFEAAAPAGGRVMKFAVQKARGIATLGGIAIVLLYAAIAVVGFVQSRAATDDGTEKP